MHAQLRREGRQVNHKHVERLVRCQRLAGAHVRHRRRGGEGPLGVEGARAWPDLVGLATFSRARPISCGAQTAKQIATGEGVLHLASVLDCFSRRIVGWQMGPVADAELVAGALEMAVGRRRPGTGSCTTPTAERRAVHRAGPRADVSRPRRMSPGTPQPLLGRRHTGDGGPTGGAAPWWAPSSSRPFGGHGLT